MAAKTLNLELKHAVIDAYREELRDRYAIENVRRFPDFDGIALGKLASLRDFFLDHIYPASADRDRLDEASDQVRAMLKSPRQLLPMFGLAMGSILRFGASLPAAARTTVATMEAFEQTRKLEDRMMRYAEKNGISPIMLRKRERMVDIIAHIPRRDVDVFRNDVLKLFAAMAQAKFLQPAIEIMERGIAVMQEHPRLYTQEDLDGFAYGRDLLNGCIQLYSQLSEDEVERILLGIEALELDWYEGVLERAAQASSKM